MNHKLELAKIAALARDNKPGSPENNDPETSRAVITTTPGLEGDVQPTITSAIKRRHEANKKKRKANAQRKKD